MSDRSDPRSRESDETLPWFEELERARRRYLDFLGAIGGEAGNGHANAWADALQRWWQAQAPLADRSVEEMFSRFVDQGAAMFGLLGALSQPGADPWQHLQREFGKGLEASLAGQSAGVAQPYEFLRGSADLWSRFSELVAGPAAALLRPADAAGEPRSGRDPVRELRNWLDLPGLGILGARQDELRELVRALAAYQEAVNDYLLVMIEIGAAATTRMREAMAERDGDPAVDARALYGLWVECCESAYAERVAEDGFAALYGRLINSGIALRRARQVLIDRWLESAGMPASSTLDGVYRALDRSRREQRRLRERLDALEKTAVAGATAKRTARAGTRAGKEAGAGTERATKKKTAKKTKSTRTVSPTARPRPSTGAASKRPAGRRRSPRKPAAAG